MNQWIEWNALYGQWDDRAREPMPDRESWRRFTDRILALDRDRHAGDMLHEHKPLMLSILEDEYLAGFYWRDPTAHNKQAARYVRKRALGWFVGHEWTLILDQVLERVYLLRCQLIHGAATYGGKLNRASLRHTSQVLGHLLPAVLLVIIDHGADEDWGPLCYPPHAADVEGQNGTPERPVRPR